MASKTLSLLGCVDLDPMSFEREIHKSLFEE
jgi:hypothetical protein